MRVGYAALLSAMIMATLATPTVSRDVSKQGFFEDFDDLSRDVWRISDGWSNGRWQNCTWSRRNVSVENGILTLSVSEPSEPAEEDVLCGEVQTHRRFGHGTYEVRMRTGRGSGLNAAFFTYIGPVHEEPHDEIDVEILTRDTSHASFNTYLDGVSRGGTKIPVPGGTDADFVHYAFEWTPDRVTWFVNGEPVHEVRDALPIRTQKIWISHWSSGTLSAWMGQFDAEALPSTLEVDWVGYTALDDQCHFPQSLTCVAR